MSLVLTYVGHMPVVRVARMAGQYAKPRSSPTELVREKLALFRFVSSSFVPYLCVNLPLLMFEKVNGEEIKNSPSPTSRCENGEFAIQSWDIPPFNKTDVFDVTGAGDTVVAAMTLALCVGASGWEAAVLGNLAASIVVRQFGTATTTAEEMKEALKTMIAV